MLAVLRVQNAASIVAVGGTITSCRFKYLVVDIMKLMNTCLANLPKCRCAHAPARDQTRSSNGKSLETVRNLSVHTRDWRCTRTRRNGRCCVLCLSHQERVVGRFRSS